MHLDHFMRASEDFEGAQYRILSGLQHVRQAFSRNIIYPHLGDLIKLYDSLTSIIRQLVGLREAIPGIAKGLDPGTNTLIYEKPELGSDRMAIVEDLIRWSLPHVRNTVDEGRMVFEFVEENIHMEEVGILPSYVEEGYLIMPDSRQHQTHVLQYSLSVFTCTDERYRTLKTTHIKSIPRYGVHRSPQSIKLELLAENRALPNPATYFFATDLDFPFDQTIFPVAKRKLIQYLAIQGSVAQGGKAEEGAFHDK